MCADQIGAAIEASALGEMALSKRGSSFRSSIDRLGEQSALQRRSECFAEIAHRKPLPFPEANYRIGVTGRPTVPDHALNNAKVSTTIAQ